MAAIAHRLIVRSAGIRPEIPKLPTQPFRNRVRCAGTSLGGTSLATPDRPTASISLEPFKPLSLETIKAQTANVTGAAAMCASCVHTQTLSQRNTVNASSNAVNPRGDEQEMKL
jgi:hypothetical protein